MKKSLMRKTENPPAKQDSRVALGFRAHSGWTALTVLAGPPRSPRVVERARIVLIDPAIPGSKQPYHAAREMNLKAAEDHLQRCAQTAQQLAEQALRALIRSLKEKGYTVVGTGIIQGSGRALTTLESTLASHPLVHTAEGELFRNALAHAGERCGLLVTKVKERELFDRAEAVLRVSAGPLRKRLDDMGKPVGSPWRQDEKYAALIAWLVLAQ